MPCLLNMRNSRADAYTIEPASWLQPFFQILDSDIIFFVVWMYLIVVIIVWVVIGFSGFVWKDSEGHVRNWYNEECKYHVDISEDTYTLWVLCIVFASLSVAVEMTLCNRLCRRCPVSDYEPQKSRGKKNRGITNARAGIARRF